MAYSPIFAGITAALCWGTSDFLSRSQSERIGFYKTVVYSQAVTLIVILATVPFISPNLALPTGPVLALIAAGGVNFIAFILLYRSFYEGAVSVVAPITYTYPAVTAVLAVALLGASLSPIQTVSIAGITTGVILLSTRFSQLKASTKGGSSRRLSAGAGLAVGASASFGVVYFGVGFAAPHVSVVLPVMLLRAVAVGAGFLLAPVLKTEVRPGRHVISKTILAMGILEGVGFLTYTYGIEGAGSSLPVVTALSSMGGAVAAGYGITLLRERLEPNQVLGIFLSLAGVFMLLFLGG